MSLFPTIKYEKLTGDEFPVMAWCLFNVCVLNVNGVRYRMIEVEFYLKSKIHPDEYTHCNPDQLLMNTFYFHKMKTGTYKSGTFKGMDITCGDSKKGIYFGILVRAIENMETGEIIEGPCNTVNRILKEYDCSSIMEFTGGDNLEIFGNRNNFTVEVVKGLPEYSVSAGPRIGLKPHYPDYHLAPYRFVAGKNKIKKSKTKLTCVYE